MRLSPQERVQLRATALDKATRIVCVGMCEPSQVYALAKNFCDYMELGIEPFHWNRHDDRLADMMEDDDE